MNYNLKLPKGLKDSVKHTVGYKEANNKNSFMVGANVAFMKSEDYYESIISSLEDKANMYETIYNEAHKDFNTIIRIFNQYKIEE